MNKLRNSETLTTSGQPKPTNLEKEIIKAAKSGAAWRVKELVEHDAG